MCELRHHPCDDFVTHKMCTLPAKWIRQPARVALSTETIYAAEAGSGRAPPLSRTYTKAKLFVVVDQQFY